jgi:hypothetical protein
MTDNKAAKIEVRWKKAFIASQREGLCTISVNEERWLDEFLTTPSASSVSGEDGDF